MKKLLKYTIATAITLVILFSIAFTQKKMDSQIKDHELFFTGQIDNAPPMVVFTTMALGSFRGLVADLLWLRAASLQESKNYYEMAQLASWITKLQPRFATATAYLAWNMAYNISVTCSLWEDRWYWVWEGIRLIRDEALLYNPDDQRLYWELAVIFQQKMGNVLDNASYYYKSRLAAEMGQVLTPNPNWEMMRTMPKTKDEFMKRYPEGDDLWKDLRAEGIKDYDDLKTKFQTKGFLPNEVIAKLGNDRALKLDTAMRNIWLYEKYRLDSAIIYDLNKEYGDIDWRLPEAQAIYWASEGIRRTGRHNMQCARIIATSLQAMTVGGRVIWMKRELDQTPMLILEPNLDLIKSACRTYDWAREEANNLESFRTGKINYMKTGVLHLYNFNRRKDAEEVFEMLKETDNTVKYGSLEEFVDAELKEKLESATFKEINDIVMAYIRTALINYLNEDEEGVRNYELRAMKVWNDYQNGITGKKEKIRRGLAPYPTIRNQVVKQFLAEIEQSNPAAAATLRAKLQTQAAEREAEKAAEEKK